MSTNLNQGILALYDALAAHFAHEPHWWPIISDTPQFEILLGAVLVQQTRWETVEAAVVRLRDAGLLSPAALAAADTAALAALIRPCAFHMQKAPGLQAICRYLVERYAGSRGFVYCSTGSAYAYQGPRPLREDDPPGAHIGNPTLLPEADDPNAASEPTGRSLAPSR